MPTRTRMSLAEFLAIPDVEERRLELIDGEVCEKVSPRWIHGRLQLMVASLLEEFGYAAVEARTLIANPGTRRPSAPLPDVAFYREAPQTDDWLRDPPNVVVEVLSPDERPNELRLKISIYLDFGVESLWVVDPERRTFEVHEQGSVRTLSGEEVLGSPAVPGLSIRISDIFARLDERGPRARRS